MPVWGKYYTVRYHFKSVEICSGWSISAKKVSKGYRPELLSTSTLESYMLNTNPQATSASHRRAWMTPELAMYLIKIFFFQIRFYMRTNPFYAEVELNFISVFWPHLPNGLHAAYEVAARDEVRFFKGNTFNFCCSLVAKSRLTLLRPHGL